MVEEHLLLGCARPVGAVGPWPHRSVLDGYGDPGAPVAGPDDQRGHGPGVMLAVLDPDAGRCEARVLPRRADPAGGGVEGGGNRHEFVAVGAGITHVDVAGALPVQAQIARGPTGPDIGPGGRPQRNRLRGVDPCRRRRGGGRPRGVEVDAPGRQAVDIDGLRGPSQGPGLAGAGARGALRGLGRALIGELGDPSVDDDDRTGGRVGQDIVERLHVPSTAVGGELHRGRGNIGALARRDTAQEGDVPGWTGVAQVQRPARGHRCRLRQGPLPLTAVQGEGLRAVEGHAVGQLERGVLVAHALRGDRAGQGVQDDEDRVVVRARRSRRP